MIRLSAWNGFLLPPGASCGNRESARLPPAMFFRLESAYLASTVDSRSGPASFTLPSDGIVVTLRPPTEDEIEELAKKPWVSLSRAEAPRVEAILEIMPSEKIAASFTAPAWSRQSVSRRSEMSGPPSRTKC